VAALTSNFEPSEHTEFVLNHSRDKITYEEIRFGKQKSLNLHIIMISI